MRVLWEWVAVSDRLARYKKGHHAEWIAALFLRMKCYKLLALRYKTRVGEIDLVMRKSKQIIFVEVKARADMRSGLEAISSKSQARIQRSAESFVKANPKYAQYDWRFDAVIIKPYRMPYHLKDAWRP
jgi:putative endonuclease